MPRINPFALKRPDDLFEVRSFTDALQNIPPFEIGLRAQPEYASVARRIEIERLLTEQYLTGDAEYKRTEGASGVPPMAVPVPGRALEINAQLLSDISLLMQMEEAGWGQMQEAGHVGEGEAPYSAEEWVVLSASCPNAFSEIILFAFELLGKASGNSKNSLGTSTGNSSESDAM